MFLRLYVFLSLLILLSGYRWNVDCQDGCTATYTILGSVPDVTLLDRGVSQPLYGQGLGTLEIDLEVEATDPGFEEYLYLVLLDQEQTRIPDVQYYGVDLESRWNIFNVKSGVRYPLQIGKNHQKLDIPYGAHFFPVLVNPFKRKFITKGFVSIMNRDGSHYPISWDGLEHLRPLVFMYAFLVFFAGYLFLRPQSNMEDGRDSLSGPQKAQRRFSILLSIFSGFKMLHLLFLSSSSAFVDARTGLPNKFLCGSAMFFGTFSEIFMFFIMFMAIASSRHNSSTASVSEIRVACGMLIGGLVISLVMALDINVYMSRSFFGVFGQILVFCGFTLCIVISSLSNRDQIRNALISKNMTHTTPRLYARQKHIKTLQNAFFTYAFVVVMGISMLADALRSNIQLVYYIKYSVEFAFTLFLYSAYFKLETPDFFKYAFKVPPKKNRDANAETNNAIQS